MRPAVIAAAFAAVIAFAAALAVPRPAAAHDGVHVGGAFARFLPGAKSGAAYMEILNHAAQDDRLVAAFSRIAGRVELHSGSVSAEGIARMEPMPEGLPVPAGGTAVLAPGGDHLMFMDLAEVPQDGATVPVTLVFERAGEVTLDIPVDNARALAGAEAGAEAGAGAVGAGSDGHSHTGD